jgi:hypothetical protein
VMGAGWYVTVEVIADGAGLVSHAGTALLSSHGNLMAEQLTSLSSSELSDGYGGVLPARVDHLERWCARGSFGVFGVNAMELRPPAQTRSRSAVGIDPP